MKILNVNLSLDPKTGGGTAERTFQLTRWLGKLGVDCKVIILNLGSDKDNNGLSQGRVIYLNCINRRFYIPVPSYLSVSKAVKETDVIHMMNHWTLLNVFIYVAAKINKKPYVLCPAGALSYFGRSVKLKKLYNHIIGKRIIRDAEYCIAITQDEANEIHSYGVDNSKISLIPNGIDEDEYKLNNENEFRAKYGLTGKSIILFVGRLNSIKGVDLLLDAFIGLSHQYPDNLLVIAGPDEGLGNSLEAKISSNNLHENIKLIGYLGPEFKSSAYHAADFLVIPSRREAMSIVVLEAGITAKPVLITNKCGFDDVGAIGGGLVVEASIEGLTQGLHQLLSNKEQLNSMGMVLKTYVRENYLWGNIAKVYLELFAKVVNKK